MTVGVDTHVQKLAAKISRNLRLGAPPGSARDALAELVRRAEEADKLKKVLKEIAEFVPHAEVVIDRFAYDRVVNVLREHAQGALGAATGSQFPRPTMEEIGKSRLPARDAASGGTEE